MIKPRVKIVAVASNEGKYLPQWLHHHYYFGFSAVDIYVNRSYDTSGKILKKLVSFYPNVNIYTSDWVDRYYNCRPPHGFIQEMSYMQSYSNSASEYDYVMFIDIDEFWFPANSKDSIGDCLLKLGNPDCVVFEWLTIGGFNKYVQPLLANKYFYGTLSNFTKIIVKTGLNIKAINVHVPACDFELDARIANGDRHRANAQSWYTLHPAQRRVAKDYFILHDANRTEINTFAKFRRGGFDNGVCNSIETMSTLRSGFHTMRHTPNCEVIENKVADDYYASYRKMYQSLRLYDDMPECDIVEHLLALDFIRMVHDARDSKLAIRMIGQDTDQNLVHKQILNTLTKLDQRYCRYLGTPIIDNVWLYDTDLDVLINKYLAAINLYPLALDSEYCPLFMRRLARLLINHGKADMAANIINDKNLMTNKWRENDWANWALAEEFRKNMDYNGELEWLKKISYPRDKKILYRVEEIEWLLRSCEAIDSLVSQMPEGATAPAQMEEAPCR